MTPAVKFRDWVLAHAVIHIDVINADCCVAHERLAGLWVGNDDLFPHGHFWPASFVLNNYVCH